VLCYVQTNNEVVHLPKNQHHKPIMRPLFLWALLEAHLSNASSTKRGDLFNMSIKTKLFAVMFIFCSVIFAMTAITYYHGSYLLESYLNSSGLHITEAAAKQIDLYMGRLRSTVDNIATTTSALWERTSQDLTDNDVEPLMRKLAASNTHIGITDVYMGFASDGKFADGVGWKEPTSYDCRQRSWYLDALNASKTIITQPYLDMITKTVVLSIVTPIYHPHSATLLGVVGIDVNLTQLSDMATSQNIMGHGYGFLIDETGLVLAHPRSGDVLSVKLTEASGDINESLAHAARAMLQGGTSFHEYTFNGDLKRIYHTRTDENLFLGITFPMSEMKDMVWAFTSKQLMVGIIGLLFLLCIMIPIVVGLTRSISGVIQILTRMAHLDFSDDDTTMIKIHRMASQHNEVGTLIKNTMFMRNAIRAFVKSLTNEITGVSSSSQNIAAMSEELHASMDEVTDAIRNSFRLIKNNHESLRQITASVGEMASGSATLAQNVSELANASGSTKEHVSETMERLASIINRVEEIEILTKQSLTNMDEVLQSVSHIQEFTTTIDDISKSTNLLSINAQIEAAKSGEFGRSFAVVAEEIGKLSRESKTATEEIKKKLTP